jgi:threonine aldolase
MRQVGVLAAAGLYALDHHIDRLADDHARASAIAKACAEALPGVVDPSCVDTNIVVLDLRASGRSAPQLVKECAADGLVMSAFGEHRVRLVTHLDIDDAACTRAAAVLSRHLSA